MDFKFLGVLKEEIAEYWNISEHKNKPILVYSDRMNHVIKKHLKDFGSIENIEKCYESLTSIIRKPDYVFYNNSTRSLEYFKKIDNDICVAVRVNPGKVLKVKSWFPANKRKIENRRKKEVLMKIEEQ